MDLHYQSMKIVNDIKQEAEWGGYNANKINKASFHRSYTNYDDDCNSVKVEDVKISRCDEYTSAMPTFEYTEDNRAAVMDEIENIKYESCVDMDTPHQIVDLGIKADINTSTNETFGPPLKGINYEQTIDNGEPFKLTADTKESIKVEKDMLGFHIKVEEQELGIDMDSTKQVLTEELDIKPDSDVSDNENSDAELHRAIKKKIEAKEHRAVCRKADKTVFICYQCNFIVNSKKDLIYHINVGHCSSKGCAKDTPIVRKHQSNEYICDNCHKIFKSKVTFDDHVVKKHAEMISSVPLKIHQCKHCCYGTAETDNLAKHMEKHLKTRCSVKPKRCIHCDKIFKTRRNLDDHVVRKHKESIASVMSKIYQCKYCSYKTVISSVLVRHMTKHPESGCSIKPKLSKCIHCDEIFKSKVGLDDHVVRKHEEFIASVASKIHQCQYCSYKTVMSSALAKHMTKHPECIEPKWNKCIHCDEVFKSKRGLDDYVVRKHSEFISSVLSKIHQCKYCSYKTIVSYTFAKHMKRCEFKADLRRFFLGRS